MTINDILKEHPEYAHLPIAYQREDGGYDFIGDSGFMSVVDEMETNPDLEDGVVTGKMVLVFSGD